MCDKFVGWSEIPLAFSCFLNAGRYSDSTEKGKGTAGKKLWRPWNRGEEAPPVTAGPSSRAALQGKSYQINRLRVDKNSMCNRMRAVP